MGCGNSTEQRVQTLEEQFAQAGLNNLLSEARFENELERQIFMAINMCRYAPAKFEQIVTQVKQTNRTAQAVQGTLQLRKHMKNMPRLPTVRFDEQAAMACRRNNDKVCGMSKFDDGGNISLYDEITGKTNNCAEYTQKQWNEQSGANFVALQLILNWGRVGPGAHKSPILDKNVTHVGMSMKAHQEFANVTQVLYVRRDAPVKVPVAPVQPVQAAPVTVVSVTPVQPVQPVVVAETKHGFLKLHLKSAHLKHHHGPPLERMSPFIRITIGNFEWKSVHREHAGHNPEWGPFAVMDYEVINPDMVMRIEVLDHEGLLNNEPMGHAECKVGFFARPGGAQEWLELNWRMKNAGRIHFISEYTPQTAVVVEQPRPVVVEQPRPVEIVQPVQPVAAVVDPRQGRLKIHLREAHIEYHEGGPIVNKRRNPFVKVLIGPFEWKSVHREHEGINPQWGALANFDFEVRNPDEMMRIEVKDHAGLLDNEPFGHAEVPIGFFARPGGCQEWIELKWRGMNAGRIHFTSEFFPAVAAEVVVNPAPVMAPPVMQPPVEQQPVVELDLSPPVEGFLQGFLKLHLKSAHLEHHEGPPLERMSPFVKVTVGDFEWKSAHKEHAGRNPEWGAFACMDYDVHDSQMMMRIEVKDHEGLLDNEAIGHAEIPLHFFARPGGRAEWIGLKWRGMNAGRVHFTSEFSPRAVEVIEQPRPVEVIEEPRPVADAVAMGGLPGFLKMHLKSAHLEHHSGPPLERMSPQVMIRCNDFEWKSRPSEHGGRNPEWGFEHCDLEVIDHRAMVHIEVRDHEGFMDNEPIGKAKVEIGFFCKKGEWSDWIELKHMGMPAGRIHFKTEFRRN